MKLRIRDNSVRLRLERGEVDALSRHDRVAATTSFANGAAFAYVVESSQVSTSPEAIFADNSIIVRIPAAAVEAWANSGQVSMQGEQSLEGGETLSILVEKDFACLAPREGEDESDMFPHPQADDDSANC
jgi:hypothetical protein